MFDLKDLACLREAELFIHELLDIINLSAIKKDLVMVLVLSEAYSQASSLLFNHYPSSPR